MLTKGQQEAADAYMDFIDNDEKELIITGAAGTGKSYLVRHLIKLTNSYNTLTRTISGNNAFKFACTSSTHKAASALQGLADNEVTTIHSFLGLVVIPDYKTGHTKIVKGKRTEYIKGYIVFIDEASCVDTYLKSLINELLEDSKIVWIGDKNQLSPVKEAVSPVFNMGIKTVELTEIQRQLVDSPILKLAEVAKQSVEVKCPMNLFSNGKEIEQITREEMQDRLDNNLLNFSKINNTKIIGYTNNIVSQYGSYIRKVVTGNDYIYVGENVTNTSPILNSSGKKYTHTDSSLMVDFIGDDDKDETGIPYKLISLNCGNSVRYCTDIAKLKSEIKSIKKAKDWVNFYRLQETYIDLRPHYAVTAHKAQGSTYENVYIDVADIGTCTSHNTVARLLYVAITRASHKVVLIGDLPLRLTK